MDELTEVGAVVVIGFRLAAASCQRCAQSCRSVKSSHRAGFFVLDREIACKSTLDSSQMQMPAVG